MRHAESLRSVFGNKSLLKHATDRLRRIGPHKNILFAYIRTLDRSQFNLTIPSDKCQMRSL